MSTECYRDFFPSVGDAMGLFMKRNIDLLDQHSMDSDNVFGMNRRGCEEPDHPPTDPTRVCWDGLHALRRICCGVQEVRSVADHRAL